MWAARTVNDRWNDLSKDFRLILAGSWYLVSILQAGRLWADHAPVHDFCRHDFAGIFLQAYFCLFTPGIIRDILLERKMQPAKGGPVRDYACPGPVKTFRVMAGPFILLCFFAYHFIFTLFNP